MIINFPLHIYILMMVFSFLFDVVVNRIHFYFTHTHLKTHHFTLSKYILSLFFPFIVLFLIYANLGYSILHVYIVFSILGAFFEYLAGWWYYKVMGSRLWTYNKYSIHKYTSFLAIPLWGFLGVILYLLVKLFK